MIKLELESARRPDYEYGSSLQKQAQALIASQKAEEVIEPNELLSPTSRDSDTSALTTERDLQSPKSDGME